MVDENSKPAPEAQAILDSDRLKYIEEDFNDPVKLLERVYLMMWHWADFHLFITSPDIEPINPPLVVHPEPIPGTEDHEHVYVIYDHGNRLSTSKAEDMFAAGMSMCKLYYTIEKMIAMLIARLETGGIDKETEVQVAFMGQLFAQRKAFESIINLAYNVVVTNFEPDRWGDWYIESVKRIADKGYGYPSETPRSTYKQSHGPGSSDLKR